MDRVLELAKHFQIPAVVVINKVDLNEEMGRTIEATAEKFGAPVLGRIPYDPVVTQAMVKGETVIEHTNGSVTGEIREIGRKLLEKMKS